MLRSSYESLSAKPRLLARVQRHQIDRLSHTARTISSHGGRTAGKVLHVNRFCPKLSPLFANRIPHEPTVLIYIHMESPVFISDMIEMIYKLLEDAPYLHLWVSLVDEASCFMLFPPSPANSRRSLRSIRSFNRAAGTSTSAPSPSSML